MFVTQPAQDQYYQDKNQAESQYKRIGAMLMDLELISDKDLSQALAMQQEVGGLLGQALLRLGAITEENLLSTLSKQLELAVVDPLTLPVDIADFQNTAKRLGLSAQWFESHQAFAWFEQFDLVGEEAQDNELPGNELQANELQASELQGSETTPAIIPVRLKVIAQDPLNLALRETIDLISTAPLVNPHNRASDMDVSEGARSSQYDIVEVEYLLAPNQILETYLSQLKRHALGGDGDDDLTDTARLREMAEEAPVIDFVNNVFAVALKEKASDIHIEAFEHAFQVRYRIDGILHKRQNQSRTKFDAIASRIKLIAGMDIAERRIPQDGRHTFRFAGNDIDLRVSSVPSTWGESLVLRLLRKQTELPDLKGLGLTGRSGRILEELISLPNGVLLVTGPTGSGKSTTLYRSLEKINNGHRKIITIEDPVEYDIDGIPQIQVNADIGYDFANGLRAILRQDPDVIMVGEIRDGETAGIAAQAALTGHFVLSTLHTNSSLAAITRLEDIGLERFLISDAVRGLMAQRLVRKVCDHCSIPETNPQGSALCDELQATGIDLEGALDGPAKWTKAVGCDFCDHTGYSGRMAVFEVAKLEDDLTQAVIDGASLSELFTIARKQGFLTLFEDGLLKARAGHTTLTEVRRVCGSEGG